MIYKCKISLAANPEVIFPLVSYCQETGKTLVLESSLKMDMVYVAAFIFMFLSRGMKKHFPAEFKKMLPVPY